MTLSEVLPELVGDAAGALVRQGRGGVADQLSKATLTAWTFDEFAQATYLQLAETRDPGAIGETISLYDEIGVNVDLDGQGHVLGLEVFGYEQLLARLRKDAAV
jgi:uncharacterized protein YuzE